MTTNAAHTSQIVFAPSREELIRALRKRHPRISDEGLGRLLDHRLALGSIDVFRNNKGEIDIQLVAAMRRH